MFYIVETSGDRRQVWGPYTTLARAKKAAGKRHIVITGRGLTDGMIMTAGQMQIAMQTRRIRSVM